jgi:pimeloyl-ACP methyl ester carboxylesterase
LAADLSERLAQLVDADRRGDAVELYQLEAIGMPEEAVVGIRQAPFRPALEAIADTLAYDAAVVGDMTLPTELLASIATPTLVIEGEASWPLLRSAARAVAQALPNGQLRTLPGQSHDVSPEATAPVLEEFLTG